MAGVILGGPNARFQRILGDLVVSYQYVNGERAMCLWPLHRTGVTPFVVCDSAAYKYDDDIYLMQTALQVTEMWDGHASRHRALQIATAIHEGLPDLIRMPPPPDEFETPTQGEAIGELVIKERGKTVGTVEVPDLAPRELDAYVGGAA